MAATYFITRFYSELSFGVQRTKIYIYMNAAARLCFCTSLPANTTVSATLSHNKITQLSKSMQWLALSVCIQSRHNLAAKHRNEKTCEHFNLLALCGCCININLYFLSQKNSSVLNLSAKWYSHVHSLPKKCRKRLENDIIRNVYFSVSVLPHMGGDKYNDTHDQADIPSLANGNTQPCFHNLENVTIIKKKTAVIFFFFIYSISVSINRYHNASLFAHVGCI